MTHDVLNPFSAIQTAAEVLRIKPDNQRMLDVIITSSTQGAAIARNTAVLSRIALEGDVPKSDIALADMLREVRQGFDVQLREAGMEFDIAVAGDLRVEAWPVLIEVFRNFTENAIRYARDGGRIHVEAAADADATTIRFSDFGATIPEHLRSAIFERRTRLHAHGQGSGLGLAIVERIIAAHKGRVWVEAGHPTGNIFCVRLPIHADAN